LRTDGLHAEGCAINKRGELLFDEYVKLLSPRTKLVAIAMYRMRWLLLPVKRIVDAAHAQALRPRRRSPGVPHAHVDVRALGCDFYAFSGHKLYGPTGIGVTVRPRRVVGVDHLARGGDMILTVSFERRPTTACPRKFEAGTPTSRVRLALLRPWTMWKAWLDAIAAHEHRLVELATAELQKIPGIQIVGTAANKHR